ncbi:hypothetical protein JL101_036305 (plasmid) [Skermanella rosea]|uniref:hypothetical protein n=1 Tax=Skermanella rosea TaxID=1817965 RepID=UPI0019346208|nr:hypothetical protein [Skermanella rosea]UEM08159.1 hypothetical protein JL101_036305 [Skermanella rosea]
MPQEIALGRTGTATYVLRGAWVYRQAGMVTSRYDMLPDFVAEMMTGALGGSWRETPEGSCIIDRFLN